MMASMSQPWPETWTGKGHCITELRYTSGACFIITKLSSYSAADQTRREDDFTAFVASQKEGHDPQQVLQIMPDCART